MNAVDGFDALADDAFLLEQFVFQPFRQLLTRQPVPVFVPMPGSRFRVGKAVKKHISGLGMFKKWRGETKYRKTLSFSKVCKPVLGIEKIPC